MHSVFLFFQLFLGVVVVLPSISPGMAIGFSATVIDQIPITISSGSWFGKLPKQSDLFLCTNFHLQNTVFVRVTRYKKLTISTADNLCISREHHVLFGHGTTTSFFSSLEICQILFLIMSACMYVYCRCMFAMLVCMLCCCCG